MNNTKLIRLLAEEVMGLVLDDNLFVDMFGKVTYLNENNVPICLDPLTDWDDCMMLVEQMIEDKCDMYFKYEFAFWQVVISAPHGNYLSKEKSLKEAICKAIAKARGIEYE